MFRADESENQPATWRGCLDHTRGALRCAVIAVLVLFAVLVVAVSGADARVAIGDHVSGATASDGGGVVANPSRFRIPVSSAAASNRGPLSGSDRIEANPSRIRIGDLFPWYAPPRVLVWVYACPDDATGTTESDYLTVCKDMPNRYGISYSLSVGSGPPTVQTTTPEAYAQLLWHPGPGLVSVTDTSPQGVHAPVVFCDHWHDGTLLHNVFSDPPVPVIGQTMRVAYQTGDSVFCEWFRFPGGVALSSVDPSPFAAGHIKVSTYVCTPRPGQDVFAPATGPQPTPDPSTGFPAPYGNDDSVDQRTLLNACHPSGTPFDFTISGAATGYSESASVQGGPALWDDLVTDDYTVTEAIPAGYGVPYVYCSVGSTGKAYSIRLDVTNGAVTIPLGPGRGFYYHNCTWFNVLPTGNPVPPDPADLGTSSITVAAWKCPADQDFETAARGGECLDAVTGLTFITESGSGGYLAQTDTGDSQAGAVFFGGIDPGLYSVRTPDNQATPVVYCDGVDVPFEDGEIVITLPAHDALQCDWYIPAESAPSATPEPGAMDPIADRDDDGIIDSDESGVYGTDPDDADTDDDGLLDGAELAIYGTNPLDADSDDDGLADGIEVNETLTNPLDADSDEDTYADGSEVQAGTNPNDSNDPQPADALADRDDDGIIDSDESEVYGTDPDDADTDDDGLLDGAELAIYGTNPLVADSDGDSYTDGYEVQTGSDPNNDQEIPTM